MSNGVTILWGVPFLFYNNQIYNLSTLVHASAAGGNTTLEFLEGVTLIVPNAFAREIFFN